MNPFSWLQEIQSLALECGPGGPGLGCRGVAGTLYNSPKSSLLGPERKPRVQKGTLYISNQ